MISLTVTRSMNSDEQEHDAFILWIDDQLYKKKKKKKKRKRENIKIKKKTNESGINLLICVGRFIYQSCHER